MNRCSTAGREPGHHDNEFTATRRKGFHDGNIEYSFRSKKGLSRSIVADISRAKGEADRTTQFRQRARDLFYRKPIPQWGGDLSEKLCRLTGRGVGTPQSQEVLESQLSNVRVPCQLDDR